ncbi:Uma2 family endonuclease [Gemmata sp. JC673]|uniref:Uma2 family endonuclease n=1 Tax=Gemmata algarum TaxID=2975278 RepID=A0ABU5EW00_9BACT|nr:Uma2 family endonuclease [Gemmata algarum]MDY3559336.1 Uma2 family endonuclease [Gemmata algarum]
MPVVIYDPVYEKHVRAERERLFPNPRDEVWDGVLVMAPLANNEHQLLVMRFTLAFSHAVDFDAGDVVLPGCNVSDRDAGWTDNYREPDAAVYLASNSAKNSDTHWVGGPDLAVEVASPGENPRLKLDFYAQINTRELLIVERDPWAVERYQLQGGKLVLVETADAANGTVLTSSVLPLTFELRAGATRPVIRIAHIQTGQIWTA